MAHVLLNEFLFRGFQSNFLLGILQVIVLGFPLEVCSGISAGVLIRVFPVVNSKIILDLASGSLA